MAYTKHGHHIPGTNRGEGVTKIKEVVSCGGVKLCPFCRTDVAEHVTVIRSREDLQARAKDLVREYVTPRQSPDAQTFEVFIIWFSKTLQNWKACVGTTLADEMYYEVTYNGDKRETYLDAYNKVENVCIPD